MARSRASPPIRMESIASISPCAMAARSVEPAPRFTTRMPSVVATETRAPMAAAIGLSIK